MSLDEIYSTLKSALGFGVLWVCIQDDEHATISAHWVVEKDLFIGYPINRRQTQERGKEYISVVANTMREEYRNKKTPG